MSFTSPPLNTCTEWEGGWLWCRTILRISREWWFFMWCPPCQYRSKIPPSPISTVIERYKTFCRSDNENLFATELTILASRLFGRILIKAKSLFKIFILLNTKNLKLPKITRTGQGTFRENTHLINMKCTYFRRTSFEFLIFLWDRALDKLLYSFSSVPLDFCSTNHLKQF